MRAQHMKRSMQQPRLKRSRRPRRAWEETFPGLVERRDEPVVRSVHEDEESLFGDSELHEEEREEQSFGPVSGYEDSAAGDLALGLYLKQMGSIPMLNRKQEVAVALRLEVT